MSKEAKARIKINKLLEEAGWRFFDDEKGTANIILENNIKISHKEVETLGDDFERVKNGFIDFLLLDEKGFPFIVLEAKSESIHPLSAKAQARKYAQAQNCRFVILSNGNQHYFWDLEIGNPREIQKFPPQKDVQLNKQFKPDPTNLLKEVVESDYIAKTINPFYYQDPRWIDRTQRQQFVDQVKLPFLRRYQLNAIISLKNSVEKNNDRFLFEMATGTGKTLTAAAVIKLFLKSANAKRVLFLVDRLELEDQAKKAFDKYLKPDYTTVIFKENRDDWRKAEIVVSTVQSFLFKNKYKRIFVPTDFDFVISDEAHRSIGGNSRAVFEYFIGYKLGLTATPKDYLKRFDAEKINQKDPRELERRILLDTYKTFGCESGEPTFRYSLLDGVKEGFLVNPMVTDVRTEITTQLLADEGYSIVREPEDEEEEREEETFFQKDFERKFFSENTNKTFCKTFLEKALRDPVTGEIGKSIIFCVSQHHATKITQILNEFSDQIFPSKYNSDFAEQVTSWVIDSKLHTVNFTNNNFNGTGNFNPFYKTSKTRVCVTVGMMTTGYDCPDILNVCLMRPIFSPTDFVQIKGRGTRKHNFLDEIKDSELAEEVIERIKIGKNEHPSVIWKEVDRKLEKKRFKLFDFFANCEFFEEKFCYDEVLKLPSLKTKLDGKGSAGSESTSYNSNEYESFSPDQIYVLREEDIGYHGMRVDRMYFNEFEEKVKDDKNVREMLINQQWDAIEAYILQNLFNKPQEYYNLEKLRKAAKVDRRLSLREIVDKIFGFIPYFKSKDELLDDEFEKFDSRYLPTEDCFHFARIYFKSYISDPEFREIIENKNFALLNTNPNGDTFRKLSQELRTLIPEYIKDNVPLNKFMA
jgi:type I restriction enzyme R subunit